jgi:hypothetical protein
VSVARAEASGPLGCRPSRRWLAARPATAAARPRSPFPPSRFDAGQATVEAVAVLPLVVLVALAAAQALSARAASTLAAGAAEAGAMAVLQDRDPAAAARAALGGASAAGARVEVQGRRVRVVVPPRTVVPGVAGLLTATASADAGP